MKAGDVQVGDVLYAVGPDPSDPRELALYRAVVKAVRLDGSYSEHATPEDLADAVLAIELADDRSHLGFPQWVYKSYEVGAKVHRSAAGALNAFALVALARASAAEKERDRANAEARWALTHPEVKA